MHDIDNPLNELLDEVMEEPRSEIGDREDRTEMELASELLGTSSEAELEQFLDKLVARVAPAARRFLGSATGKTLTRALKGLAAKALPVAGAAIGNFFAPGIGGAIGSKAASGLGSLLGLELEGASEQEAEMEVARRVVRIAQSATNQLLRDPRAATDPTTAVRSAIATSVQRHLPLLVGSSGAANGRWVRRGNRIVLYGA